MQSKDESTPNEVLKGLLQHFRMSKSKPYKYKESPSYYRPFCDYYNTSIAKIKDEKHRLEVIFWMVKGEANRVLMSLIVMETRPLGWLGHLVLWICHLGIRKLVFNTSWLR